MVEQVTAFFSDNWLALLTIINSVFLAFGVKWYDKKIQSSVNKEIEFYKSILNKEIEEYKINLNILYYKKSSYSKIETKVLKELWSHFIDLFYNFQNSMKAFKTYPDVNSMSFIELNEYIDDIDGITESQKERILKSNDKQKEIQILLNWISLVKTKEYYNNCVEYLDKNSVFVSPKIKEKFNLISKKMRENINDYDIRLRDMFAHREEHVYKTYSNVLEEVENIKKEIEKEIQQIFFPDNIA